MCNLNTINSGISWLSAGKRLDTIVSCAAHRTLVKLRHSGGHPASTLAWVQFISPVTQGCFWPVQEAFLLPVARGWVHCTCTY